MLDTTMVKTTEQVRLLWSSLPLGNFEMLGQNKVKLFSSLTHIFIFRHRI